MISRTRLGRYEKAIVLAKGLVLAGRAFVFSLSKPVKGSRVIESKKPWGPVVIGVLAAVILENTLCGSSLYRHEPKEQSGYLVVPGGDSRLAVEPYYPQAGDILLYDYFSRLYSVVFRLVGTNMPTHCAIIIERPDGRPAILEVGPNSQPQAFTQVAIVEVLSRLESYPGAIMVRRPRQPLSPEQSAELTQFALAQDGKEFAVGRLALQATPFRCRRGLRHACFARTHLDRRRWICSENVVAAATVAGLLDPKVHFANAMYPGDLAYDEDYDLSATYCEPVLWVADPHPHIDGNRVEVFKK